MKRKLARPTEAPALYAQDGKGLDATVYAHYFVLSADWWVTEYDPDTDEAFGYVCLGDREMAELGYISMKELDNIEAMGVFPVEKDLYWDEQPLRPIVNNLKGVSA